MSPCRETIAETRQLGWPRSNKGFVILEAGHIDVASVKSQGQYQQHERHVERLGAQKASRIQYSEPTQAQRMLLPQASASPTLSWSKHHPYLLITNAPYYIWLKLRTLHPVSHIAHFIHTPKCCQSKNQSKSNLLNSLMASFNQPTSCNHCHPNSLLPPCGSGFPPTYTSTSPPGEISLNPTLF